MESDGVEEGAARAAAEGHAEPDPLLPSVTRGPAAALPEKLDGIALVHPIDADLTVRVDGEGPLRVPRGALLVVHANARALREPRATAGDVLLFRARWPWLRSAFASLGVEAPWRGEVLLEDAGSDLARRAARLLLELAGEAPGAGEEPARRVGRAARWLGLVSVACAARGRSEDLARASRAPQRGAFLAAVEALGHEPLDGWTLAGFSARLGLSERHASRLFRQELDTTFQEHVAGLRIERAKQLLATTGLSVTEVAMASGWGSLSHFNSVFRRRTALTPGAYRRRARGAEASAEATERSACARIHAASDTVPR